MLEKYLEKINQLVDSFVKTIDEEYSSRMGAEFCACLNENVIEWTLTYNENGGEKFYNNFICRYPLAKQLGLFTLSVLHEIGHFETEDEMEDDTEIRVNELSHEDYFNLFNEKIATDWAGEWIEENINLAIKIDKIFYNAIYTMYENVLD